MERKQALTTRTVGNAACESRISALASGERSYSHQKELQQAMEQLLLGIPFTHHAHLVDETGAGLWNGMNERVLRERGSRLMRELHRRIDAELLRLGRNYYKRPESKRSFFVAFIETLNGYPHYHLLIRLPKQRHDINFVTGLWGSWMKVLKPAYIDIERRSVRVRRFEAGDDREAMTKYCCKELWKANGLENVIFSSQFLSPRNRTEH